MKNQIITDMTNLAKFQFKGSNITFQTGNNVMVNATEMAKPFGRQPSEWLRLPSASRFIDALEAMGKSHRSKLISSINGVGTWLHEDVAIEFARWLNPAFAIWCNDRIKELARHGFTATPQTLEEIANNPDFIIQLANNLKRERESRRIAERIIEIQAPAVEYHNKVLQSDSDYNSTTIAKELGMSAIEFHKKLNELGIMFKTDEHWVLYAKYQNKGFTHTRTASFMDSQGVKRSSITTVWTEKGREFIHKILNVELHKQVEI